MMGGSGMAKAISQFFVDLGFPLRNVRWSWGSRSGDVVLLRTWVDEYDGKARKVTVLRAAAGHQVSDSFGLDERIVQLQALWNGAVAGYTVIAEAKDKDAHPREIKSYRDDAVFAIGQLELRANGDIVAALSELVPVAGLATHAATHRTLAAEGPFPMEDGQRSGLSTDSYQQKIPAVRAWLIEVCRAKGTVTYSDVMNRFGLTFYPLRNAMSRLGRDCQKAGEPIITALIVDKDTGRCSQGLFDEFHIDDDERERQRCYAFWAVADNAPASAKSSGADNTNGTNAEDDFEQRAARFAQVEVRTQQAAFRDAVFRACGGRCVVSGCAVPEALEAAHLLGRDWRKGHNRAEDGVLLRRDLHTLYDRGLLRISDAGIVEVDDKILTDYRQFAGVALGAG
jgi:hypothetical protein